MKPALMLDPAQISPKIADLAFLIAAFVPPAYFVFRARRPERGAFVAITIFWGLLLVAGWVRSGLDPQRRKDAAILDGLWILGGWIPATFYACLLYWTKRLFVFARTKLRSPASRLPCGW